MNKNKIAVQFGVNQLAISRELSRNIGKLFLFALIRQITKLLKDEKQ